MEQGPLSMTPHPETWDEQVTRLLAAALVIVPLKHGGIRFAITETINLVAFVVRRERDGGPRWMVKD